MTLRVAVVIPYYQREAGILARALRSVAAQQVDAALHVIVVDDESPSPASADLADGAAGRWPVEVIRQTNAGPGAARNTGIDRARDSADLVAFLDSDDTWAPSHLQRALRALDAGHDVYFSNLVQLGAEQPAFERAGRLREADRRAIDADAGLWAYTGDMLEQVVTGNVIGTPAVVYRHGRFPQHRFRPRFRRAGEDYLFWMGLAALQARFCFGSLPTVQCGRGVNVYAGAGWGTDGFARRVYDEMTYRLVSEREFELSARARAHVRDEKRRLAAAFLGDLKHRLGHRKPVDWPLVARFLYQGLLPGRALRDARAP